MSNPPHLSAHQAAGQCRFWRSTARTRARQTCRRMALTAAMKLKTLAVWQHRGHRRIALTQSWSHRLVIRAAAPFRRDPGNVAVWILDVAGFAVDAILRVDHEARSRRFFDPLIDAGRTIAI